MKGNSYLVLSKVLIVLYWGLSEEVVLSTSTLKLVLC